MNVVITIIMIKIKENMFIYNNISLYIQTVLHGYLNQNPKGK